MGYTLPALRGRMGSTEYFQTTMKARELAAVAMTAAELPEWTQWSVFERFQRELSNRRVQKDIVPYLARTRDRFFNALIVLVYMPQEFLFEPIEDVGGSFPKAYRSAVAQMGFLTIEGGRLVVLDGQHRLAALRGVTTAGPELSGEFIDEVAEDELSVVFIPHETFEKTRRIFNKVNRYAKTTSPSDNIITSEDDGSAIVTRWLVEEAPPFDLDWPKPPLSGSDGWGEPVVEWRHQTLGPEVRKFTTLSALYRMTKTVLAWGGLGQFDEKHMVNRPSDERLKEAYQLTAGWWQEVIQAFTPYRRALSRPSELPAMRRFRAEYSLLFRPIGQLAFTHSLVKVRGLGLELSDALERVEDRGWSASDSVFAGTVIHGNGQMATSDSSVALGGELGAYLIAGELMDESHRIDLQRRLRESKGEPNFVLPPVT